MTIISQSYDLGESFACDALDVERRFLCIMWHHAEAGHDAACNAGLTGAMFTTDNHAGLFAFIGLSVENDIPVNYIFFHAVASETNIHITDIELDDIIVWVHWDVDEDPTTELRDLAAMIVEMADRRERAREHLRQAARLMRGQETVMDYTTNNGVYRDRPSAIAV